jgi:asparagine synthase (glutamine-hydrolysing)
MCGIFGMMLDANPSEKQLRQFEHFFDSQHHRGPDGKGRYSADSFAAGMVRLSIIDTLHGWQPLWNESQTIGIVANGEIYNYVELRETLIKNGHNFTTLSDIEVLIHLYEDKGLDFVKELRGMFSFALFDISQKKIVLGRDRLGEKPLYVYEADGSTIFSSELRSLVETGFAPLEFDLSVLESYFKYGFIPEPFTIIKNIRKVEAGTIEVFSMDGKTRTIHKYWDINSDNPPPGLFPVEELRKILEETAEIVIRADVPVGVALSSGFDSYLVASLVKKTEHNFHAFTIGYEGNHSSDESAEARTSARKLGMVPHIYKIDTKCVGKNFTELCLARDEPIADIAGHSYFELAKLAKSNGVKVLLTGQGADELFWGYQWVRNIVRNQNRRLRLLNKKHNYFQYICFSKIPKSKGPILDWLKSGGGFLENIRQLFEDLRDSKSGNRDVLVYERRPRARESKRRVKALLNSAGQKNLYRQESALGETDISKYVLRTMVDTYLRSNGLAQVDRLSMAASVEARTPLVDYKIVEFALREVGRSNNFELGFKSILIEAAGDLVPEDVKVREKKGFTPPVTDWYKEIFEVNRELFESPRIVELGLVSHKAIKILSKPLTIIGRPRLLWLELAVLEMWIRGLEAIVPPQIYNEL